ncbi:MAG: helix-turn-helix transcriptional regulator [Phenylobacterium sp.]|nr:helix-turn-helix transcriptional regulator [Phenylobacterium sp.]
MKLTPFGKLVRHHRLHKEIALSEMSAAIGVSTAFASAVETGVKRIPTDYPSKVICALDLSPEEAADLQEAAELSVPEVKITLSKNAPRSDREVVALFARRFNNLPADTKMSIRHLLEDDVVE